MVAYNRIERFFFIYSWLDMNYIVQIKFFEEIQNGDHDQIIKIVEKELKYNQKNLENNLKKKT